MGIMPAHTGLSEPAHSAVSPAIPRWLNSSMPETVEPHPCQDACREHRSYMVEVLDVTEPYLVTSPFHRRATIADRGFQLRRSHGSGDSRPSSPSWVSGKRRKQFHVFLRNRISHGRGKSLSSPKPRHGRLIPEICIPGRKMP